MPLLFAVTMFVSASLLFMVQPMVAKAVLPLLGGSPAVWNGCMVFFQALLLLGYLYADRLTRQTNTRKQWMIHLGVLTLPVVAFVLAAVFSQKHTPIAVMEALAPSDGSSPIISVLMILTVAIGVPFFVCATTATLLQKWFTYTGHPSARDPYFLYAASNFGSLISLLGYPIFIEPNMPQGAQTWFWAVGFVALAGFIAFCGKAAVNPLGVPPTAKAVGKQPAAPAITGGEKGIAPPPGEPPPSWARMAKWTVLAFVPSSLMLGVTFHMTTDIASIPLLWVGPLALYLVTFIIAFSRVPAWFRILIGNLAPVMILLLVFLLISNVNPGVGISLLLHLLTFFAAALMCHYELARDRPPPQYLTTYFLIMSFGGVLGGIFNSLLAPIIFDQDYEYKLVLVVSCLMVPRLNPLDQNERETKMSNETALAADATFGLVGNPLVYAVRWVMRLIDRDKRVAWGLDIAIPILVGVVFWQLQKVDSIKTYSNAVQAIANTLTVGVQTIHIVFVYALPVMVCFFFVDRPLRFALCVGAILGISVFREETNDEVRTVYTERSFFGILKVEQRGQYTRLVHGTTLHGTQINERFQTHYADEFQQLTALNPFENIIVAGARLKFNAREEPLTYYHRTGPVGAMFNELQVRKGGADANAHFAMVGLGTGSVSCYAHKGQKLTYYEIDPAVIRIVGKPWKVMNEKELKERGSAPVADPEVRKELEKLGVRIFTQEEHEEHLKQYQKNLKEWEEYKKELKDRGCAPITDPELRKQLKELGGNYFTLYTQEEYEQNVRDRGVAPLADPRLRKKAEDLGARIFTQDEYEQEVKTRPSGKEPMKDRGVIVYTQEEYEQEVKTRPAGKEPVQDHVKQPLEPIGPKMGPFTFVDDAKKRGAEIDFRVGDARLKLKQNTEAKYSLLLVDAFSSDSIPVHLLTVEAVQLYLDRMTEDGILALHISNKFVKLEPVVAAIAAKFDPPLVARVWNDESEGRPGKTASSWVALARKREYLGDKIGSPLGDLVRTDALGRVIEDDVADVLRKEYPAAPFDVGTEPLGEQLLRLLKILYPDLVSATEKVPAQNQKAAAIEWLDKSAGDAQAKEYATLLRKHSVPAPQFAVAQQKSLIELLKDVYSDLGPVLEAARIKQTREKSAPSQQEALLAWLDTRGRLGDEHAQRAAVLVRRYSPHATTQQVTLNEALIEWLEKRTDDARARWYAALLRKHTVFLNTMGLLQAETGYGFRPVALNDDVPAWTDDFADVMRVIMIPELQFVRKFFGQPTPVKG